MEAIVAAEDQEEKKTLIGSLPLQSEASEAQEEESFHGLKLFVGQVPRSMEEPELRTYMKQYGTISEVVIIRDKLSGAHRGCAFVTFEDREEAEKAAVFLHNKVTIPPATNPLQVRPAEGQTGVVTVQEHKLFIGMIPKSADEQAIRAVFAPYGEIEEVYILRHASTGQSKGCAFLKYKERSCALQAIEEVHDVITMEGGTSTLVVKFADSRRQRLARARTQAASAAAAYWQFPTTQQQHPPSNSDPSNALAAAAAAAAAAAILNTNNTQDFVSSLSQMNLNNNSNSSNEMLLLQQQYLQQMFVNNSSNQSRLFYNNNAYQYYEQQQQQQQEQEQIQQQQDESNSNMGQMEGPAGANLFIYHLPHDLTDADLATAFAPFGTVISAKVYMDKITGESKGFGFVSYDSVSAADAAIASMNGFQIGTKRLKVQHKRVHSAAPSSAYYIPSPPTINPLSIPQPPPLPTANNNQALKGLGNVVVGAGGMVLGEGISSPQHLYSYYQEAEEEKSDENGINYASIVSGQKK